MQEGSFLASLGMQCQTGSCVYNSSKPQPPGPPAPPTPPPLPPHEHHDVAAEIVTLIGIGAAVSLAMVLGGVLIYQDNKLSQRRYKAWSEGTSTLTRLQFVACIGVFVAQCLLMCAHLSLAAPLAWHRDITHIQPPCLPACSEQH